MEQSLSPEQQIHYLTQQNQQLNQVLLNSKAEAFDTIAFFRGALTRAEAQLQQMAEQMRQLQQAQPEPAPTVEAEVIED